MRITPIEIRQRQFEKKFRGYDIDEVSAYLNTLSNEWDRLVEENKELKKRFESSEREVQKLREVESTLYRTLKTAEDTGNNIIDQANKKAELVLREAQISSEKTLKEAHDTSKKLVEDAGLNARNIIESAKEELISASEELKVIENRKNSIIDELKSLAEDIAQKLEKYNKPVKIELYNKFTEEEVALEDAFTPEISKEQAGDSDEAVAEQAPEPVDNNHKPVDHTPDSEIDTPVEQHQEPEKEEVKYDVSKGSFFDQI